MSNIVNQSIDLVSEWHYIFERSKRRKRESTLHAHNAGCVLDPALVASNSLDRRSTTEIPLHRTPGCTNLQFRFNDQRWMREEVRDESSCTIKSATNHRTELQVEKSHVQPRAEHIFAADRTRVGASRNAPVSEKRHWSIPVISLVKSEKFLADPNCDHTTSLHLSEGRTSEAVMVLIPRLIHPRSHPRTQSWSLLSELEHLLRWIQLTPCSSPCPQRPTGS